MDGFAVVEKPAQTESIGSRIDRLWALREKKRAIEAKVSEVQALITEQEGMLMQQMKDIGIDAAKGKQATVRLREELYPNVEDWQAFYAYLRRNNYLHMLHRRVSLAAFREVMETRNGRELPGVKSQKTTKLSLETN